MRFLQFNDVRVFLWELALVLGDRKHLENMFIYLLRKSSQMFHSEFIVGVKTMNICL